MPLATGVRFGSFDIEGALGAGGMGEVYRARDTRLGRAVALKLLPAAFAADAERVARFEREAQVLASLNHQNIAQIYGVEDGSIAGTAVRALVMELVEGTTLAERAGRGALPLDEALAMAKQTADALEAAHDKGIIHRDLKPANVMITSAGVVKVLDFGLAAVALTPTTNGADLTQSPTLTIAATQAGVILGTAAYMSPEQASGQPVDKRSDIWSFGVVVWEILTGRRLFDAETISHTLADVLRAELDFSLLPPRTPASIRELLRRCLDRDVRTRLRDIGEARITIQRALASPERDTPAPAAPGWRHAALSWAAAAAAVALAATLAFVHFREQSPIVQPVRFQVLPPSQSTFINSVVLSPDGRKLAFAASDQDNRPVLYVRGLDSLDARVMPGSEGATAGFFWSPDSRFLVFAVNGFPGRLKKIDVTGGPPETLSEFNGSFRGGDWSPAGVLLFAVAPGGIWRIAETGGTPSMLTTLDPKRLESQHSGPTFLPDGRTFLYLKVSSRAEHRGIFAGSLDAAPDSQNATRLLASDSNPVYVRSSSRDAGWVLFLRGGTLLAQALADRVEPIGGVIALATDVGAFGSAGWFTASPGGHLAFRTGAAAAAKNELVWFDRRGRRLGSVGPPLEMGAGGVQISPDGKQVVVTRTSSGNEISESHVWRADVARGVFARLTVGAGTEGAPTVSANGRIAFSSTANGAVGDLYWMSASGVGSPEPLLLKSPTIKHPNDFSPDGRFLIYDDHTAQRQDLYILPLEAPGAETRTPIPFVVTPADETFGQFSPDGKWIAYSSDESGRREVYVQGFAPDRSPATSVGKWTISSAGGDKPRWSADGKELYYLALDGKLMAVPVKLAPTFEPGVAVPLFDTNVTAYTPYDVGPDGRFLLNTVAAAAAVTASPVTVVLNWEGSLRR